MIKAAVKLADLIVDADFFAPPIVIRYKSKADYQTLTSGLLSIALIILFGVVFVNSFISMVNKTSITSTVSLQQQVTPSQFTGNTNTFMFAVGLNGINMNTALRYFNTNFYQITINNGSKNTQPLTLQPCQIGQWSPFGTQFQDLYVKLNFTNWLCPTRETSFVLSGKYSSDIFQFLKVSMSNCTGVVNGYGCRSTADIQAFFNTTETFSFNFYYVNTQINPTNQDPSNIFLDDSNNYPFSLTIGTAVNFYMQTYSITTDNSLLPFTQNVQQSGIKGDYVQSSSFPVNQAVTTQYIKFFIRRSSTTQEITRSFFKFDQLLSYIGGLFGLIFLVINIPLYYYNLMSYELNLATDLYNYSENNQEEQQPHSVNRFNFMIYLAYLPYHLMKYLGWKSLNIKLLKPYNDAITAVRKQIDILKILKQFAFLRRVSEIMLDEHQIKLLHLLPKDNLLSIEKHRSNLKLHKRISKINIKTETQVNIHDTQLEAKKQLFELKNSYQILKERKDEISKKIIKLVDPAILTKILQTREQTIFNSWQFLEQESASKIQPVKKSENIFDLNYKNQPEQSKPTPLIEASLVSIKSNHQIQQLGVRKVEQKQEKKQSNKKPVMRASKTRLNPLPKVQ